MSKPDNQLKIEIDLLNGKIEQLMIQRDFFLSVPKEEQINGLIAELEVARDVVSRIQILMSMIKSKK